NGRARPVPGRESSLVSTDKSCSWRCAPAHAVTAHTTRTYLSPLSPARDFGGVTALQHVERDGDHGRHRNYARRASRGCRAFRICSRLASSARRLARCGLPFARTFLSVPSRYASISAGGMYDLRQTALVLPSVCATASTAATTLRLPSAAEPNCGRSRSARSASTLPAQARKSFAVKSFPLISRRYSLTSAEPMLWISP